MKINECAIERYRAERKAHRWRDGLPASAGGTVVEQLLRVRTDGGVEGVCWLGSEPTHAQLLERVLAPHLMGCEVWNREAIWRRIWEIDRIEVLPISALAWVDVALWDLQAKTIGVPCYQLMGGHKSRVKAYASTVTLDSTAEYLRLIDDCLARGYRAVKLHVWGDVARDIRLVRDVRRHVGPGIDLMLDGSAGYTFDQSVRIGRAMEEEGYLWLEEPMREYSLLTYQRLCIELRLPVLAAEMSPGCHFNAAEWLCRGACDRLRTSWWCKGGMTGALKVGHLAESFEMAAEVHGDDLGALHLACALPNAEFVELLVPENVFGNATLYGRLYPDELGWVQAPDTPGIGWDPDPSARVG